MAVAESPKPTALEQGAETPCLVENPNTADYSNDGVSEWLSSLESSATNSATNNKVSGVWVELVKVKKWYSCRLMRWDATNKRKEYVRYLGTLKNCKNDPIYSSEAKRLEKRRFAVSGGKIIPDTGTYQPDAAGYVH